MKEKKNGKFIKVPLYFFGGMLFSLPYTGGSFAPFAASFAASCDGVFSVVAAAGSIVGTFLFHSGLTGFRYFAVILTSAATLNTAIRLFRPEKENLLRILCPAVCSFSVNFIFLLSQETSAGLIFSVICETALCAVSVPVFREAIKQIRDRSIFLSSTGRDRKFLCFILFASLAAAHLRGAGIAGEAVCCFLLFFMILFFSQVKGFEGGVITGICCSFVFAMNGEADFACTVFSLCGCLCSFFNTDKRTVRACIAVSCAAAAWVFGEYTDFLSVVPSGAAAGILFCVLPGSLMKSTDEKDKGEEAPPLHTEFRGNEIACAVGNLSDCVSAARTTLAPLIKPELKNELIRVKDRVCGECEICDSCINEIKNPENMCYENISAAFDSGEPDFSHFPANFSVTCCHSEKMLAEMKKAHFIHCAGICADSKISRMQTLAGNQFRTFGGIIGQACESAADKAVSSCFDSVCAASAAEFGIEIKDARLCTDQAGREYFDVSFLKPHSNFSVTALTEKLKKDTGYQLDFPTLVQNGKIYDLIFRQSESLTFNIAAAVKPAAGKSVCGDYYRCFKDSFSRRTVLLSDGMGTGSRAAVDSAFTCETFCNLIKSGLDEKTAAAAVNCAMMIKSTDESFSTIDFLRLDPVLKTAEIFKCGAAPSFILKKKKVSVIETESTPIGILDNVNMSVSKFDVAAGDIILIASDGVSGDRFSWICGELKNLSGRDASYIAKHILQCALDRKIGRRTDDMTVIAVCAAEKKSD